MRVAVFSHAHPTFSKGGGELAAYYLYKGINETPGHEAWFIGRVPDHLKNSGTPIAAIAEREYLMAGNADIPNLTATVALGDDSDFADLLHSIQPDVIHFHHYVLLGVEIIRAAKRACPQARIVLTLHEYIAICMNFGQMIKTNGHLCHQYSPRECHLCFPDRSPEDFFLRERYIKSFFNLVDVFISPSEFLRDRYVAWGIPEDRIVVIENGLPPGERVPPRALREGEIRGRFAYFGQINPFKGVDIVIEAFARLPKKIRKQVSLDIFGSGLDQQTEQFRNKVQSLLDENSKYVRYHGPYEPEEMGRLMADVDWAVMGSIWWENSPLVIQEAFKYGRPVICPDIGGMAEKVRDLTTGLHFRARDPVSLAEVVERAVTEEGLYDRVSGALPPYSEIGDVVAAHLKRYGLGVPDIAGDSQESGSINTDKPARRKTSRK
jgi:glycosyltransferase involved in cell wall biosynthesis